MTKGNDPSTRLQRGRLPPAFERWRVRLEPGAERPTDAAEWAGALVCVESGRLEVDCLAGGQRAFVAGDMLALGWLPLRSMRNPGTEPVELVCVRRRGSKPSQRFLHVRRASGIGCL